MGYSNGQLETSSGTGRGERGEPGLPGIGFNLTDDGNFDLDRKRLTDVADPVDLQDAATKKYVDDHITSDAASKKYVDDENARQDIAINSKAEGDRVLPLDGSKSMTGNLQMGSKRITGLADGSDDKDAVNYSQLLSHTRDYVTHYQLVGSFRFYHGSKEIRLKRIIYINGHKAHKRNYEISGADGTDSAGGGEAWFDLKMTNTLESGTYTVVFEIYPTLFEKGNLYHQNNEVLLQSVYGDSNFQIITFSHDWQSNSGGNIPHSKAYIQFNSNDGEGTINFQIRYYGSNYADSRLAIFFFARTLKGKHDDTFNHDIFDIREGQGSNDQFLFFEDINMNDNRIYGLPLPTGPQQPATKKYVDDNALPLSGGTMKGSFSMSGNRIYNLPIPTGSQQPATKEYTEKIFLRKTGNETTDYNADSKKLVNLADPTNDDDAANKGYVLSQVGNVDLTAYLRRDGTQSMTGNLQMGDNTITGIRSSSRDDAALTNGGAKSLYLPLAGNKGMQGILNMSNNAIRYLKMPRNDPSSGNPPDDCAINFKYFHDQALNRKRPQKMEADLDMNGNNIIRLKDPLPSNSQYAASVNFVNKSISESNANLSKIIDRKITEAEKFNIKSSTQNNAFLFVMDNDLFREDDNDITKVGEVDKDFNQIKKATYEFTIKYDTSIKYYSTRLSIDLISLPLGEYTLVFEMYYSGKTDKNQVTVNATSGTLTVSRTNTNTFSDHSRSIINFHKYIFSSGYEDLDIDIALKNRAGESYDPNTTIYVIVYGVTGHQNEVSTLVWDSAFALENKALKLKANIDMNEHDIINVDNLSFKSTLDMGGKEIKNVGDGTENGDAVNIKQLNESESILETFINRKITGVDKNLGAQKVELIKDLNDAICDYSFSNWKVCEFYVTDGNDYDGSLRDRKPNAPFLKLEQSDTDKQPVVVANGHAGNAYFSFNVGKCLNVDYNLNNREYISVFIVYTIHDHSTTFNGIWGNENGGHDKYIAFYDSGGVKKLFLASGNSLTTLDDADFPSKAHPVTNNKITLLSVHYNTFNENNSELYCNGKQLDRFITEKTTGQNTFSIGAANDKAEKSKTQYKEIFYFSLFHNYFFNPKDIKRMHRHLCERYSIDHDPIDIS